MYAIHTYGTFCIPCVQFAGHAAFHTDNFVFIFHIAQQTQYLQALLEIREQTLTPDIENGAKPSKWLTLLPYTYTHIHGRESNSNSTMFLSDL